MMSRRSRGRMIWLLAHPPPSPFSGTEGIYSLFMKPEVKNLVTLSLERKDVYCIFTGQKFSSVMCVSTIRKDKEGMMNCT